MPQLDSLRAAAVTVVMLWHFTSRETYWRGLAVSLGVRLFFILSGFLITALLLIARDDWRAGATTRGSAAQRFYLRRILRIVPIYYLTLLAAAAVQLPSVIQSFWWHAAYLSNVKFALDGWAGPTSHFWTLSVEEQFYFAWPWIVLGTSTSRLRQISVVAIIVAPLFRLTATMLGHPRVGDLLPFGVLDALAAGALLSTYWHEHRLDHALHSARAGFAAVAGVLAIFFATGLAFARLFDILSVTLLTALLVPLVGHAALGFQGVAGRALGASPVRYMGKISYGIYVYHNFMPNLVPALGRFFGVRIPHTGFASVATLILASVAVAAASWHAIERPLAALKSRIPNHDASQDGALRVQNSDAPA